MRILTWNIHGARDASPARIAQEIAGQRPDVVCLNEVRRRHGKRLGRMLRLRTYVASSFIGPYGNAILTNEPIASWRRLRFAAVRRVDRRDAAIVHLRAGVTIVAVHLNLRRDERVRNASELLAVVADRSIIAGDLNETPDDVVPRMLAARLEDGGRNPGLPTFPSGTPRARIDYVWVPAGTAVRESTVVPTTASDHLPVVVDIDSP